MATPQRQLLGRIRDRDEDERRKRLRESLNRRAQRTAQTGLQQPTDTGGRRAGSFPMATVTGERRRDLGRTTVLPQPAEAPGDRRPGGQAVQPTSVTISPPTAPQEDPRAQRLREQVRRIAGTALRGPAGADRMEVNPQDVEEILRQARETGRNPLTVAQEFRRRAGQARRTERLVDRTRTAAEQTNPLAALLSTERTLREDPRSRLVRRDVRAQLGDLFGQLGPDAPPQIRQIAQNVAQRTGGVQPTVAGAPARGRAQQFVQPTSVALPPPVPQGPGVREVQPPPIRRPPEAIIEQRPQVPPGVPFGPGAPVTEPVRRVQDFITPAGGQPPAPTGPGDRSRAEELFRQRTQGDVLGGQRPEAISLFNLGGLLERRLARPSRFDLPVVQESFDFLSQDLEDEARRAESQAVADAARRGVFFGSPLTTSLGDISERLQRGRAGLATDLLLEQARTAGGDVSNAIAQALQFGRAGTEAQAVQGDIARAMLSLGLAPAPTIGGATQGIAGIQPPGGGGGLDPQLLFLLGTLLTRQPTDGSNVIGRTSPGAGQFGQFA